MEIDISKTIQDIHENGHLLFQSNVEVEKRSRHFEVFIINILKDSWLEEIKIRVGSSNYHLDPNKRSICITSIGDPKNRKTLNSDDFEWFLQECSSREEKIQFIKDVPEILTEIKNKIESLHNENEDVLQNTSELLSINFIKEDDNGMKPENKLSKVSEDSQGTDSKCHQASGAYVKNGVIRIPRKRNIKFAKIKDGQESPAIEAMFERNRKLIERDK